MSEIEETTDERDPIADAILHGGESRNDPFETRDEAPVADEQPVADELILGKFKSVDDVVEAYKNLESHNTQTNQRLSELESLLMSDDEDEPQQAQPWGVSFNGDPENEEQLIGWAERDAGAAAQWAMANANRVPQETVNSLWEHWFETKPAEANAWYVQQQTQQIRQQYEEELTTLREQITPLRDQQTQTLFESSLESLESQIPDLADYSEKIQNYIDNIPVDQLHLAFFPQGMDTPEKIQTGVKSLYAIVRMQEQPVQHQAVEQPSAFTQSRQGVADTGPVDYAAKINAAILNG
jgi:hypothetical protein